MKKKIFKFSLIFIILVITCVSIYSFLPAPKYVKEMFRRYQNEYTLIADICYKDYQKHDNTFVGYSPGYKKDNKEYYIHCYLDEHELELNEQEYAALSKVISDFNLDNHPLEFIYAYDGFVTFGIANKRESLIFSVYGTRPSYVNSPDEGHQWFNIRKITDNWYFAFE